MYTEYFISVSYPDFSQIFNCLNGFVRRINEQLMLKIERVRVVLISPDLVVGRQPINPSANTAHRSPLTADRSSHNNSKARIVGSLSLFDLGWLVD